MDEDVGASRPKIHRLPEKQIKEGELYVSRTVLAVCLALLLVAVIPALLSFRKIDQVTIAQTIPVDQGQFAAPTSVAETDPIAVQDDNGQLVGQITKMPADMDHSASIKTTSKVDPKTGKELMNIISKY